MPGSTDSRQCPPPPAKGCGEWFTESYHKTYCRACAARLAREYRRDHPYTVRKTEARRNRTAKRKAWKRERYKRVGAAEKARWREANRERVNRLKRRWRAANKDRINAERRAKYAARRAEAHGREEQ